MRSMPLPIIDSCEGCGACCLVVSRPPFVRVFGERGEDAWERLRWDLPDLAEDYLADEAERRKHQGPFFGTPCSWFDPEPPELSTLRLAAECMPGFRTRGR